MNMNTKLKPTLTHLILTVICLFTLTCGKPSSTPNPQYTPLTTTNSPLPLRPVRVIHPQHHRLLRRLHALRHERGRQNPARGAGRRGERPQQ
jgi:hypothetical protein